MKKIILYIASSLDGFIADKNNSLDWLTVYKGNYGYKDFMGSVDTVLMGRATYDWVAAEGMPDPYPHQLSYVFTSSPDRYTSTQRLFFTSKDPIDIAQELKNGGGKNIFLVGGGGLISTFLEHDLIDEIILFIVPVVLGGGVSLFQNLNKSIAFETSSAKKYEDGMIEIRLKRR